jgi:uncharacterized protein (DUF58 family)
VNLARLNRSLIPETYAERERLRRGWLVRLFSPLIFLSTRLTQAGRTLLTLTIVVGAFGVEVQSTQVYVVFALMAGLCLAVLLPIRLFALDRLDITVRCARRVSLGAAQRFDVELCNQGPQPLRALSVAVQGPFLPSDGRWEGEAPIVEELPAGARAQVTCTARFRTRGEHHLDPFAVAALLPLGLSNGRPLLSAPVRFLVVPVLAPVTRISLPVAQRHQPGGVALASKTGESMDLLGIRPYRPGDPIRDLHARSWARLGQPIVREYQEEYFSRIGVVVDTDSAHADPRRLEAALSLAAGIVARLSRGEALIDLLVVGDEVHALTVGRSLGFLDQALDLLACVKPGRAFVAETPARLLAPFLSRLSAVIFVGLTWDDERARFAHVVRGQGVACQCIVVEGPANRVPAGDRLTVPVQAIENKEPLCL